MRNIFYLFIVCLLFSCDIINPEEEIPSFIEIESITVNAIPDSGTNIHNITEAWVFVDNVLIGAFIPGKPFPVLDAGTKEIMIQAGIHEDGISVSTKIYPYMESFVVTEELVPGEVLKINPVFQYRDNIDFFLIDDFENSTFFTIDRDGDEATTIAFESVCALEGQSAKIVLTQDNPVVNIATIVSFALPVLSFNDTYIELSFKSEVPVAFGLISNDGFGEVEQIYRNGLNANPSWTKVYLNAQENLTFSPAETYQVGFGAELPVGQDQATIMIDNVKLLHYKP